MERRGRLRQRYLALAIGWALTAAGLAHGQGSAPIVPGVPTVSTPLSLPVPPTGPVTAPHGHPAGCRDCRGGLIHRAIRHTWFTLQDRFIGFPDQFVEPPLGFDLAQHLGTMKAKADPHEFFLYRSDFVQDGTALSPGGALRLTSMANRLPGWLGPIVVEWTPDRPPLAEARKAAILSALASAGIPIEPDRLLIGPSPYPGLIGDVAAEYYPIYLQRSAAAPATYSLPPTPALNMGGGASGITGGMGGGLP